jgi:hypothetical protein
VKSWIGASDWDPDPGDFLAANVVRFGIRLRWLDETYTDQMKGAESAARSCSWREWENLDVGIRAGTSGPAEMAFQMEAFRREILGDLQQSCTRLQQGMSLACGELVPFDTKDKAVYQALQVFRGADHFDWVSNKAHTAQGQENYKALWREDYLASVNARNAKIDPQDAAIKAILAERASAVDASLAKVGSVETKRSFLGIGASQPNPAAKTLHSKLQTLQVFEKLMRIAAGQGPGVGQSRWQEAKALADRRLQCELCWLDNECGRNAASTQNFNAGETPGFLRKMEEQVSAEILVLQLAWQAEKLTATNASHAERNKAARDKIVQAWEEARARNIEAQAKRGTPEDPDGKLADQAAAEEAQAKHRLDLGDCVRQKVQAAMDALAAGATSAPTTEQITAECEKQIRGTAVAGGPSPPTPSPDPSRSPVGPPPSEQPEPSPIPWTPPPVGGNSGADGNQGDSGAVASAGNFGGGSTGAADQGQSPPRQPVFGAGGSIQSPQQIAERPPVTEGQAGPISTLSPEEFSKAVQAALERLGVKPRTTLGGEPIYNEFSPSLAQKAGLDIETAIVAAAFQEQVPASKVMQETKLSDEQLAKALDLYLEKLQGMTSVAERTMLVRRYMEAG